MKQIFIDTVFLIALLNHNDTYHRASVDFYQRFDGSYVTSEWILLELADGMSYSSHARALYLELRQTLLESKNFQVVPLDSLTYTDAIEMFGKHNDKRWSLTDCTSFVIMKDQGLTKALTADHHFTQAGFEIVLTTS